MLEKFDYKTYRELLELIRRTNKNLCFEDFNREINKGRYFILRHDVDYSPEAALRMAEVEMKMGVWATYFVLLNASHYNLLSHEYCAFPRRLIELGHEVGLHYDVKLYEKLGESEIIETFQEHARMLSRITGQPVKSIAMHDPSICGLDPFRALTGYINAYDDKYTKEIVYFSDSCGAWRDEAIIAFESKKIPTRFQLLVHPILWNYDSGDQWARLNNFVDGKIEYLKTDIERVKDRYVQHLRSIRRNKEHEVGRRAR